MKDIIGTSARQFNFLADSPYLNNEDIAAYKTLISADADGNFTISDTALERGLLRLSSLLAKHYRKQVIILMSMNMMFLLIKLFKTVIMTKWFLYLEIYLEIH